MSGLQVWGAMIAILRRVNDGDLKPISPMFPVLSPECWEQPDVYGHFMGFHGHFIGISRA